jgi:hypothetical protein
VSRTHCGHFPNRSPPDLLLWCSHRLSKSRSAVHTPGTSSMLSLAPSDTSRMTSTSAPWLVAGQLTSLSSNQRSNSALWSSKDSRTIAAGAITPLGTRDEAYTLNIPSDGSPATLSANSTLGLFRGLTTFSQIWYTHGSSIYTVEAPISISDSPAFVRRSLIQNYSSIDAVPTSALPRFYVGHGSQLLPS